MIDSIQSGALHIPSGLERPAVSSAKPEADSGFAGKLQDAVQEVDTLNQDATFKVSQMIDGGSGDVHDAMIAVEKADLSFQLMLQVRNKVVQAYQQIANMQF